MEKKKIKGKIEAVSPIKKFNNVMQIGFLIEKVWYNVEGLEEQLKVIQGYSIKKGNLIEFDVDEKNRVENINLLEKAKESESGNSWDDTIKFEDLLDAAHKQGLCKIKTEMISIDFEKKTAVFKAIVVGMPETIVKDGKSIDVTKTFSAYGDATQDNTSDMVKKHWIRMAETRSICRALRWFTNNAKTAEEETSGEEKK